MKSIGPFAVSLLGAAFLIAVPLTLAAQQLDSASVKQPEMTPSLNLGKMNYDVYCASCHGSDYITIN